MRKILYLGLLGCGISLLPSLSHGQDLIIPTISLHENVISENGSLQAYASVRNIGNKIAGESSIGFYISTDSILSADDHLVSENKTRQLGSLESDSSFNYIDASKYKPGNYFLIAFADYQNKVKESKEKNNTAKAFFTISSPYSDLVVSSFSSYYNSYSPGATFQGISTISNIAGGEASYNYVGYYLSEDSNIDSTDSFLGSEFFYNIPEQSSSSSYPYLQLPYYLFPGTYYVIAKADIFGNVPEIK